MQQYNTVTVMEKQNLNERGNDVIDWKIEDQYDIRWKFLLDQDLDVQVYINTLPVVNLKIQL